MEVYYVWYKVAWRKVAEIARTVRALRYTLGCSKWLTPWCGGESLNDSSDAAFIDTHQIVCAPRSMEVYYVRYKVAWWKVAKIARTVRALRYTLGCSKWLTPSCGGDSLNDSSDKVIIGTRQVVCAPRSMEVYYVWYKVAWRKVAEIARTVRALRYTLGCSKWLTPCCGGDSLNDFIGTRQLVCAPRSMEVYYVRYKVAWRKVAEIARTVRALRYTLGCSKWLTPWCGGESLNDSSDAAFIDTHQLVCAPRSKVP